MLGHFCALDSVCALVCVELRRDPVARVALPRVSVELLVPSRRAPGGCQGCSSLSQQTASSCPMGVGVGATCTPPWGLRAQRKGVRPREGSRHCWMASHGGSQGGGRGRGAQRGSVTDP